MCYNSTLLSRPTLEAPAEISTVNTNGAEFLNALQVTFVATYVRDVSSQKYIKLIKEIYL